MHKPVIAGDWHVLYKPEKWGCFINDHSIVKGPDGWHLYGITKPTPEIDPDNECYFSHGFCPEFTPGKVFEEKGKVIDWGKTAWAPAVIYHNKKYYMIYGPEPTRMAVSDDGYQWEKHEIKLSDSPKNGCKRDHMIIRNDDGTWLMYATAMDDQQFGQISVFTSQDLVDWRFAGFALQSSGNAPLNPHWSAMESPFVIRYSGRYYLSVTYTEDEANYFNTLVFSSRDPLNFGEYTGDNEDEIVVQKLHTHAPEYIRHPDTGKWYMTNCGWRGRKIPHPGGVSIAELNWEKI